MPNIWELTATELAEHIHRRSLSATEVAEAALARLDAVNPLLNAVVMHRPDEVMERARAVDRRSREAKRSVRWPASRSRSRSTSTRRASRRATASGSSAT